MSLDSISWENDITSRSPPNLGLTLREAWSRRQPFHDDPNIDTYRIFHGHTEGCPGLDIDRFGRVAVIWTDHPDAETEIVRDTLLRLDGFDTIVVKPSRRRREITADSEAGCLRPDTPPEQTRFEVLEYGLRFHVEPFVGQNCGLFLDARPARQWIRENSTGRRVLNLFSYTGSLGVAAAAGGAASVTHVDGKHNALERARANHDLNDLPVDDRSLFRGNIYTHVPRAVSSGQRFDAVILDPPPTLPRIKGHKPQGQDYSTLARFATELLDEGGWVLCFFSRFDRSRQEYEDQVTTASAGRLQPLWRGTSGDDFPEQNPEAKLRLTAFFKQ